MISGNKYQIRADYTNKEIAVYSAFSSSIADIALKNQKLLPPFSYERLTWIKPSYLWLMYRSDWGRRAGMERILKIWISRQNWDNALEESILTTPEKRVYSDAKKWRRQLDKTRVRIQWDPERNIKNEKLGYKSIQVGITPALSEIYAKKWIIRIEDMTSKTRLINSLVSVKKWKEATQYLPEEEVYFVSRKIGTVIGMD